MLDSRGNYVAEEVIPKNDKGSGMDAGIRKLLFPSDPRGSRGILARGHAIYKGGLPSPTSPGMDPRTGKVNQQQTPVQKLAAMRLKGLI